MSRRRACRSGVPLPSGDLAILTYALYPKPGVLGGPYYLIPKGTREVKSTSVGSPTSRFSIVW